jgi:hypothetical protein
VLTDVVPLDFIGVDNILVVAVFNVVVDVFC